MFVCLILPQSTGAHLLGAQAVIMCKVLPLIQAITSTLQDIRVLVGEALLMLILLLLVTMIFLLPNLIAAAHFYGIHFMEALMLISLMLLQLIRVGMSMWQVILNQVGALLRMRFFLVMT